MKRMSLKRIVLMLAMIFSMASGSVFAQSDEVYQMGRNKGNEQLLNSLQAHQKALKKEQQVLQNLSTALIGLNRLPASTTRPSR